MWLLITFVSVITFLKWLGKNKLVAVLLTVVLYFSIVTFHDEITQIAIKIRNTFGRDQYNAWLGYFFLLLLVGFIAWLGWHIRRSKHKLVLIILSIFISGLMVFSFRFLMVYNIEAIHFVEYMMVAILLLPVLRSYGETVFWVTILGMLDELFQYRFLTPNFEYFDFNDNVFNLIGAGAGAILVFILGEDVLEIKNFKWFRSPAVITGLVLLALFIALLLTGKMTINPTGIPGSENWFSLNRQAMPEGEFWKEAYPGRRFHILRPFEGIGMIYLMFAAFFVLDLFSVKDNRRNEVTN